VAQTKPGRRESGGGLAQSRIHRRAGLWLPRARRIELHKLQEANRSGDLCVRQPFDSFVGVMFLRDFVHTPQSRIFHRTLRRADVYAAFSRKMSPFAVTSPASATFRRCLLRRKSETVSE
jgi:hypothetical protein